MSEAGTPFTMADAQEMAAGELESKPGILGYSLVVALVAGALLIYVLEIPNLASRGGWFIAGETMGITAAVLLAIAGILAVRVQPLEWLFGDLTKVYIAHGVVGLTMFGLVTAHPLLYVIGTLPATGAAREVIIPFHLVVLDWISWILIAAAMLPTLYLHLRFDLWRLTHFLLGAAIILTGVSLLLTSDTFDTFKILALRIYLSTLFVAATAAIAYVAFLRWLMEPKLEYRVVGAEHHPEANAVELHTEAVRRPLRYEAGQFTYVDLMDDRVPIHRDYEAHPFSPTSPPDGKELTFIVQTLGSYTERIARIMESDDAFALVHGAYGRLGYRHMPSRRQLWVGGGTGITPMIAMAEDLASSPEEPDGYEVTLFVAVQTRAHAFFIDRLRECEQRYPGLKVELWCSDEDGLPTAKALLARDPHPRAPVVLMSGPDAMLSDLMHQFQHEGVHHDRIHSEPAIGPPRRWRHGSPALQVLRWVVTIEFVIFVGAIIAAVIGRAVS
jgi:predicted ferric reductase